MFNKRKNKTFTYNSRFTKDEVKAFKADFDTKEQASAEWKRTRKTGSGKSRIGLPLLLLFLGLIIAVMYYLEYKL